MKALLDTHVLVWWLEAKGRLSPRQEQVVAGAGLDRPLLVCDISLWEIATLCELGRLRLGLPLRDWLERATAPPLVRRHGITPAIAAEVASLPPQFRRDPADRIIVSTARVLGATLLTSDDHIIRSGLADTLN